SGLSQPLESSVLKRNRESGCESAFDWTPNRLPIVTLVGHTINSSIQCVAMRGLGADLDADRAPDPTPNNSQSAERRCADDQGPERASIKPPHSRTSSRGAELLPCVI